MAGRNWLAKPHLQMYEDIHAGPGVNAAESTMAYYDEANKVLHDVHKDISDGLLALSANWVSAAADGAAATARASADWASAASVATIVARAQSMHQAGAYVDARNAMPEPVTIPDIAPGQGFPAISVLVDVVTARAKAAHAHQRAADVMAGYESSTTGFVAAMPAYPEVPTTAVITSVVDPPARSTGGVGPLETGVPNDAMPKTLPDSPRPLATRPTEGQQPISDPTTAPGQEVDDNRVPADRAAPNAQQRSTPSSSLVTGHPDPQNFANPTLKSPLGAEFDDRHLRQLAGGITTGMPSGRSGAPDIHKDSGGKAPPVVAQHPANSARSPHSTQGSVRATGGPPGLLPATGTARSEDKDHERKYMVLDDQHLSADEPSLSSPVIGEDYE